MLATSIFIRKYLEYVWQVADTQTDL